MYRLNAEQALVLTVDLLTPIADDPYVFGQIAAANSLSDVYAMGGTPLAALCIITFPVGEIEHETVKRILEGVWNKVREAGAVIAGGHTLKDTEIKCGLAVTGIVHPERVVKNTGARPGDVLILTKPLGTGIITTALRVGLAPASSVEEANRFMCELNRTPAEAIRETGVNAATDITGFGLLGHAWEMAQTGDIDLLIDASRVPLIPGAMELASQQLFPEGSLKNYSFMKPRADFAPSIPEDLCLLLCDAQTSGGLLIALPEARATELLVRLRAAGNTTAAIIGSVRSGSGRIRVD